jgi:hypothetical protein
MSRQAGSSTPFVLGFLVLTLVAVGGNWRLNIARRDGRHAASTINDHLRLAEQGLADLRGAEAAYLATGLKTEEWMNRATAATVQLDSAISALRSLPTTSAEARAQYETSANAIAELEASDKKARDFVASGQPLVAADVLFQEGNDPARNLSAALTAARSAEVASFEKAAQRLGWIGLGGNSAALVIGLLMMLMLSARVRAVQNTEAPVEGLNLHTGAPAAEPSRVPVPESVVDPFVTPAVDLSGAAELCVDLGRILDGRDLPALMGRAADVLDAKGLVLWVSEAGGTVLRPSVAHGYSDRVLQRMGTLPADGDNVTSLAFRTLQPQVLRSTFDGHGAIAVPLLTSGGCVGVLAAEVQGAKPGDVRFAVARMIAAQLSTLVGPGSSAPSKSAGAAN